MAGEFLTFAPALLLYRLFPRPERALQGPKKCLVMIFEKRPSPILPSLGLALGLILCLSACRPEGRLAQWDLELLAPIVKTRVDFGDFIADSNLRYQEDGLVSLIYRGQIASLKPGEIAPPFNETFQNTANIQQLTLGSRRLRNRISLGQLAGEAGVQGAILIAANGTSQVIPPLSNIGPAVFPVDATQFFQSITLQDGWLVLRLENQLPIALSNLQYEVRNVRSNNLILQNSVPLLAPNAVQYDSVHLVNNFVIEGELSASLINMDSPGSNGQSVLIDTSDAILVEVNIDKMDPVQATAVWPEQNLFDETATAEIRPESGLLNKVYVEKGKIFIDAVSSISDQLRLGYDLPGALRQGQALQLRELIPPAPAGGSIQVRREVAVEDYELDMTGLPGSTGVFNTFYTIFTGGIDSTGQLVTLSLSDSVQITTGIDNLVASRGYGYLGTDTIVENQSFRVNPFSDILSGSLQLEEVKISLELENLIGAPFQFSIDALSARGRDGRADLQWNQLGFKFDVDPAQENSPGDRPQAGRLEVLLDGSNSNIARLVELQPDTFQADIKAYLNPGVPATALDQFLYTAYGLEAYLNVEVPLHLALDQIKLGDSVDFDYLSIDPEGRIQSGQLILKADNFYPFRARVDIEIYDLAGEQLAVLQSAEAVEPAERDNTGRASAPTASSLRYLLDSEALEHLRNSDRLFLRVQFDSPLPDERIKFYADNYLDLQLIGDFQIEREP